VPDDQRSQAVAAIAPATIRALQGIRGRVLVRSPHDFSALTPMIALLADHGIDAVARPRDGSFFGSYLPASRQYRGGPIGAVLTVEPARRGGTYVRQPGERLVAGHPLAPDPAPADPGHLTRTQTRAAFFRALREAAHVRYVVYLLRGNVLLPP
jgi:hypothetical protein